MRGSTLRAVPVCLVVFACGCFLFQQDVKVTEVTPRTPTHAYWQKVGAILAQKPTSGELPALVAMVRAQTEALRDLPMEGVDAELIAAVENVIKCEDEVLRRADMVNNNSARLRESEQMAQVFADANRAAADAKKRVKTLQPTLNQRHGGGFPALGG